MKCIMLSGIPYSGKTTYLKNNFPSLPVIDTDSYIEAVAEYMNTSYNDIFDDTYQTAERIMYVKLKSCVSNKKDFVIDRTLLSVKSRKKFISLIPEYYNIECHYFEPDIELSKSRKELRPEKVISDELLESMNNSFQKPTIGEGFFRIKKL